MIGLGIWFFAGALAGLMWLYNLTNAFDNRELTVDNVKEYVVCLLCGGLSLAFMSVIAISNFFENHGSDIALSWGKYKKEKVIKGLDD